MTHPHRRRWPIFRWTTIVLVTIATLVFVWQLERARALIRQSLERQPWVRVAVGRVRLGWPPGRVVIENVTVSAPRGGVVLSMPRLTVTVNPLSLAQRSLIVSRVSAEAPRLMVATDRLNEIREILAPAHGAPRNGEPGRTPPRKGRIVVLPSTVSLTGGTLHLETRGGRRELTGISGRLVRTGSGLQLVLGHPAVGRLTAEVLLGQAGEAPVTVALKVGDMAPVSIDGRGTVAGDLSGTLQIAGQDFTGDLRFSRVRFEWPGLPAITDAAGRLRISSAFVKLEEFEFRSGEASRVVGHALLRLRPPLRLTFGATAPRLDLTPWVGLFNVVLAPEPRGSVLRVIPPAHAADAHPRSQGTQTHGPATRPEWTWIGRQLAFLRVDGSVRVTQGQIGTLRFTNASAHVLASDGRWVLQAVRISLNGGEQRGYLKLSFRERSGEIFAAADRLHLDDVYALLVPGGRSPGGRASYSAELRWKGLTWAEFRQSLSGTGVLRLEDGWLPARVGVGDTQRSLRFSELTSRFRVSAGRVVTDDLEIRGEPWAFLRGGGQVDFGGKLALSVASPPDRVPRLRGFMTGDLTHPHLTILKAEF